MIISLLQGASVALFIVLLVIVGIPKDKATAGWFIGFGTIVAILSFGGCWVFGYHGSSCLALQENTRLLAGEVIGYPLVILGVIGLVKQLAKQIIEEK